MDFETPDFLQECDVDTIHQKMMDELPTDIDKTEGGFPWDFTRPTALISAELLEFYVPRILMLMFPQWSTGQYLDLLATMARVARREAQYATVNLVVTGVPATIIPTGTIFSTVTVEEDEEPVEFVTGETNYIDADGSCTLTATAVEAGKESNVSEGTIVVMSEPLDGVTGVTNPEKASGGTDEEDDDTLRERVLTGFSTNDESYIGNDADYKRWAESVSGMGNAIVVSEWNGPETVKIVCTDANGDPANDTILDAVYEKIMSPDAPLERLAPPNTILTVCAPELVKIAYAFTAELEPDYELADVKNSFEESLEEYYKTVSGSEVKYTRVCAILSSTAGINDFDGLTMNGAQKNIQVSEQQYPYTESVTAELASGVND